MSAVITEREFGEWSWHDNIIYGLQLDLGDTFKGDWHQDLIFDIDFIAAWVCGTDGGAQFRIAPASLTFHEVTDLRVRIDFGDTDCSVGINELSIAQITRTPVDDKKRFPDKPYYRWRIELNLPQDGEIAFGARGFTQTLRTLPVLCDEQRLPAGTPR